MTIEQTVEIPAGADTRKSGTPISDRLAGCLAEMEVMTEEEADALDELLTRTTPRVNPAVRGITARKGFTMIAVDDFSAEYITSKALATRQTPEEIIGELVRKEIATAL
jgi:hypothetical protein